MKITKRLCPNCGNEKLFTQGDGEEVICSGKNCDWRGMMEDLVQKDELRVRDCCVKSLSVAQGANIPSFVCYCGLSWKIHQERDHRWWEIKS
jgi:hypothetical protein